jgi:ABC-type antimicrobial peptide transport system permease subunit
MSLDFVEPYRTSDLSLIVVPQPGQKAVLDAWLENNIANEDRLVYTYSNQQAAFQKEMSTMLFTFALMESVIVLMAALALTGLNYTFITQRQAEFGVLNALGFGRRQLVGRVARETLLTTGAAWLVGLLVCAVILAYLQYGVYTPSGLRLNFFNLTPWLFTLPIPLAVVVASVGTIGWTLSRLDPVAVIEKR